VSIKGNFLCAFALPFRHYVGPVLKALRARIEISRRDPAVSGETYDDRTDDE
jgi:hypothetical protein